jgi:hypothetical protein
MVDASHIGGINDAALLEQQPFACQMRVDLLQDVFGQVALLQEVAEVQDRGLVGMGSLRLSPAKLRSEAISYSASSIAASRTHFS